jgi:D-alanine-D-alanine ligase
MSSVAVVFGGPSPEHDISILTGLMAARTLLNAGTPVVGLYWAKSGDWYEVDPLSEGSDFLDGVPKGSAEVQLIVSPGIGFVSGRKNKSLGIETIINACHGGPGEDGSLQAAMDLAAIRATGPAVWAASLAMDKLAFGAVVEAAGLPTLPRRAIDPDLAPDFAGPYIAKPRFGGSSIGIEVVDDYATAVALLHASPHMDRGGVLEPFLADAMDLNVSVRSFPELSVSAIERPLSAAGFYDYKDKYLAGGGLSGSRRELPADIPADLALRIAELALTIGRLVGVRSVARLDFLWTGSELYVNEINPIPGSLSTYLWEESGVSPAELLKGMLEEAQAQRGPGWTVAGADGSALRDAGSIAAKLG